MNSAETIFKVELTKIIYWVSHKLHKKFHCLTTKKYYVTQGDILVHFGLLGDVEALAAWKLSKYGVISGPYFSVFGLNAGKSGPEITRYLDNFHAVSWFQYFEIWWMQNSKRNESVRYCRTDKSFE